MIFSVQLEKFVAWKEFALCLWETKVALQIFVLNFVTPCIGGLADLEKTERISIL